MSMTLQIPDSLETQLRRMAAERGVEPADVGLEAINSAIGTVADETPSSEAELLTAIGRGFPSEWWERYKQLVGKRRVESIDESELAELISLTNELETLGAWRTECLVKLADLRNTSVDALMREMDLRPEPMG